MHTLPAEIQNVLYQLALGAPLASEFPNQVDAGHSGPPAQDHPKATKKDTGHPAASEDATSQGPLELESNGKNMSKRLLLGRHEN